MIVNFELEVVGRGKCKPFPLSGKCLHFSIRGLDDPGLGGRMLDELILMSLTRSGLIDCDDFIPGN